MTENENIMDWLTPASLKKTPQEKERDKLEKMREARDRTVKLAKMLDILQVGVAPTEEQEEILTTIKELEDIDFDKRISEIMANMDREEGLY